MTYKAVAPNTIREAENLLNFLHSIKGKYILAGQHNYISSGSRYTEEVFKTIGKYPVVWGCDFSWSYKGDHPEEFQHCGPLNLSPPENEVRFLDVSMEDSRQNMIEEVKKMHARGHIITLMWHSGFPSIGDECEGETIWTLENRPSDETWKELVTEGTTLNSQWKNSADVIANYLKQLQKLNIPILWRPYHEMNGVWFWWCAKKGENGFKKLWIMLFKYFTEHHKLNNLIWVWNTNSPRETPGDEAYPYKDFFPGIEYVDVLAADIYWNDYKQSHHDQLVELGKDKPIALGEVGQIPTPEILKNQNKWTWIMPWGALLFNEETNKIEAVKTLYNLPQVLSLENVSIFNKEYRVNK